MAEDKKAVPQSETKQPDEVAASKPSEGKNPLKVFGNNIFRMSTSIDGNRVDLYGLLSDQMPTLNMKASWGDGPGKQIGDKVSQFMNNEALSTVTFLAGDTYKYVPTDAYTSRMYKNGNPLQFSLTFKAFKNDPTYSGLSTYSDWMTNLKKGSMVHASGSLAEGVGRALNVMKSDGKKGLDGAKAIITDGMTSLKKAVGGDDEKKDEGEEKKNKKADKGLGQSILDKMDADQFGPDPVRVGIYGGGGEGTLQGISRKSDFGAKIWELYILPGIFKEHFVVYVGSFTVKMSEEVGPDYQPLWAEITISCTTDRILSRNVLKRKFRPITKQDKK